MSSTWYIILVEFVPTQQCCTPYQLVDIAYWYEYKLVCALLQPSRGCNVATRTAVTGCSLFLTVCTYHYPLASIMCALAMYVPNFNIHYAMFSKSFG